MNRAGGSQGGAGVRKFWTKMMDDNGDAATQVSGAGSAPASTVVDGIRVQRPVVPSAAVKNAAPVAQSSHSLAQSNTSELATFTFKVKDFGGNIHRIQASPRIFKDLQASIKEKLGISNDEILLKYKDDDGDEIILSSDASLVEGVTIARTAGSSALFLTVTLVEATPVEAPVPTKAASISAEKSKAVSSFYSSNYFYSGLVVATAILAGAAFAVKSKRQ